MYSNRIPVLLIAVLVLLAGCAGGADVAPAADADDTDTPTDGGGSADTGASSDGDDFELSDPERLLRDAGSFTVSWSYTGVETAVTREFAADLDAERSYSRTTSTTDGQSDAGGVEQYVADGVTYVRVGGDDEATYTSYEGSTEVLAAAIALSQARAYGADDDLTFAGTETFDGASVERYELSAANEALILAGSAAAQGEPGTLEVTSFEYVVLVDEDGLSRHESWSFSGRMDDGSEVSGSWEYSLTGVGSTTVEEPAWLDEARA
ncbi:DUF7537 family lipoprotein [Haloferax volcanii]|uniref:Lipoprotein n=3 Tax=Haloferax volcanii TaxID=2246 RepID=D4GS34_HALVD|nr:hypothetical protein [Haloferax volcanii]ADE02731.1 uncharacterized protein HVO_0494 [Haloferax volcanii DS2]ELY25908.1 hypothetical protein C498_16204 [Haloferax volcanii DS2]MBS8118922.1 hypothetical protein [Haloferax volcanii]MBS8123936.1 hypothetical protein [Haloferax volcanii]MBS8127805.1 hypothetical protein [Haloferax volcanii]